MNFSILCALSVIKKISIGIRSIHSKPILIPTATVKDASA
jgi:hypothetical protein